MFTTPRVHSVSHTRFTRRRATLAPPSRGVQESRGCCDVFPAPTRCGPLQRRPPGLGSERTHKRAAMRRKAVQMCHQITAEVRATLELYRSELEGTRARLQSDRVSRIRKTIRQSRRGSRTGTTVSALSSLYEAESELALGRSAPSSVCEYVGFFGRETSSSCGDDGAALMSSHVESPSVYTSTHEPSYSAFDFRREGTPFSRMTLDAFGAVRDAGLVTPNVLPSGVNEATPEIPVNSNTPPVGEDHGDHRECTPDALTAVPATPHTHLPGDPCLAHVLPSGMSSVQPSPAADRASFALVVPANGVNESMPEIPANPNTPPFGEDYGDHRECALDALTINKGSSAAVPVTPHTHPPGVLCLAQCRKQDWPRRRRVGSRTTHAAMNNETQGYCLFSENPSAQVHSLSTPKECTICDEMHMELLWCEICSRCTCFECHRQEALEADHNRNAEESESGSAGSGVFCLDCGQTTAYLLPLAHQTECSECHGGSWELIWCECCRAFTCYECWVRRALVASETSHPPCAEPDPAQRAGGWCGEGEAGGENGHPPP